MLGGPYLSNTYLSDLLLSSGRTAGYPYRPHTDPDVRDYRIRLLSYIFARVKHNAPNTNQRVAVFYSLVLAQLENILTYL